MKKEYISDVWQLKQKGHENFEFVDVAVNGDNLLFIDPCLIERWNNAWAIKAMKHINSYFDKLFKAYNTCNRKDMKCLLSHAGEQNATRLGYGNGDNGKGNTADGLLEIFQPLEQLISSIRTIGKAEDLPLLIPGFAEDGMSDLLTNILHECLNEFTMEQMHKYGILSNGTKTFYTWDMHAGEWKKVEKPVYFVNGKELLLVRMDARLIIQVIINIVDNAIKYTQEGSDIYIKARKEGRYVIISIEDNGAGIPDDMKENVFDTFFTCNNEIADNRRSLGLGLSLCKTIINAHGSELELRDNTPHGCIFEFKLQLSEVHLNE